MADKTLKALVQINLDGKLRVPGTKSETFTCDEETAQPLLDVGAAEEVRADGKTPAKTPAK